MTRNTQCDQIVLSVGPMVGSITLRGELLKARVRLPGPRLPHSMVEGLARKPGKAHEHWVSLLPTRPLSQRDPADRFLAAAARITCTRTSWPGSRGLPLSSRHADRNLRLVSVSFRLDGFRVNHDHRIWALEPGFQRAFVNPSASPAVTASPNVTRLPHHSSTT